MNPDSNFSMTAAVLEELGKPLAIRREIPIPVLKDGQVLVKMAYSGVCRSQLMEVRGLRGTDRFLPHLLGHEGTGQVVKIGKSVSKVKQGDLVVLGWIKGSGHESGGSVFEYGDTLINAGGVATFATYSVVSENRCVKLPHGIPLDLGVLFGCALLTGAGIVFNEVSLLPSDHVAVWGLGGIGLSALMACQLYSCKSIIAIDVEKSKLELARSFGATHLIDSSTEDSIARVREITGGAGVDYSIEASGRTEVIEMAFQSVRQKGGLCIFASHPPFGEKIRVDPYDLICGKELRGTWGGQCMPDRDIVRLAELYREGKLPLKNLLSKPYSLSEINRALDDLESGKTTRALIEINPEINWQFS